MDAVEVDRAACVLQHRDWPHPDIADLHLLAEPRGDDAGLTKRPLDRLHHRVNFFGQRRCRSWVGPDRVRRRRRPGPRAARQRQQQPYDPHAHHPQSIPESLNAKRFGAFGSIPSGGLAQLGGATPTRVRRWPPGTVTGWFISITGSPAPLTATRRRIRPATTQATSSGQRLSSTTASGFTRRSPICTSSFSRAATVPGTLNGASARSTALRQAMVCWTSGGTGVGPPGGGA